MFLYMLKTLLTAVYVKPCNMKKSHQYKTLIGVCIYTVYIYVLFHIQFFHFSFLNYFLFYLICSIFIFFLFYFFTIIIFVSISSLLSPSPSSSSNVTASAPFPVFVLLYGQHFLWKSHWLTSRTHNPAPLAVNVTSL